MSQENTVSTGAETQNQAPAADEQASEVVTPETQEQSTESAAEEQVEAVKEDDRDKAIKRMERRINVKHAQAAAAEERARILEQRLAQIEAQQRPANQDEAAKPLTQAQIDEFVHQEAQRLTDAKEQSRRAADIVREGEKIQGWDAACVAVQDEIPMVDRQGRPTEFAKAVFEADNPAKLMHHLGTHLELLDELQGLSPSALGRNLARIERDMSTQKTSAAPKPLSPVKPTSASSAPDPAKDVDGYIKWRQKQRANS